MITKSDVEKYLQERESAKSIPEEKYASVKSYIVKTELSFNDRVSEISKIVRQKYGYDMERARRYASDGIQLYLHNPDTYSIDCVTVPYASLYDDDAIVKE